MKSIPRVIFALLISAACADEISVPKFKGESKKYLNPHENCALSGSHDPGKEWECSSVADELIVGDITETELTFWLWVIGTNNHQCFMAGTAQKRQAGGFEYTEGDCKLLLSPSSSSIKIEDIEGKCRSRSCGSRAGIGNLEFKVQQ